MAAKKGKHLVTSAQTAAILAALDKQRKTMPGNGMTGKQILSAKKKRETANGKILVAEFKGRQPPKKTKAQIEKADLAAAARKIGQKGHGYDALSSDQGKGQQAMRSTVRADAESAALGKPRKKDESWLVDTLNFIGRPMFATAEAAKDNQEKYYRQRHKGASKKKALWEGFKAGFGGWGEGISGKKKTTFSDVIQEAANNQKANKAGIGAARDNELAPAKVNPWLKHGVGFTLDVLGDPLTYVGVGAVTKAAQAGKILKGEEVAQNLVKNVDTYDKVINSGAKVTRQQLHEATGLSRAPVEQIKRLDKKTQQLLNSNPQAKALYEQIRLERKTGPKFKRKGAGETAHFGRRVTIGSDPKASVKIDLGSEALTKLANDVVEHELKIVPALHSNLKAGIGKHADDHPAWSNPDGSLTLDPKVFGDRKALQKLVDDEAPGWGAVAVKTPEEYIQRTILHELGHQVAYRLSDDVVKGISDNIRRLAHEAAPSPVTAKTAPTAEFLRRQPYVVLRGIQTHLKDAFDAGKAFNTATLRTALRGRLDDARLIGVQADLKAAGIIDDTGRIIVEPAVIDDFFTNGATAAKGGAAKSNIVNDFVTKSISGRAAHNEREMLAEVWVAHRTLGKDASPLIREIGEKMESYAKSLPVAPVREAKVAFDEIGQQSFAAWAKTKADELAGTVTGKELDRTLKEQAKKAGMLPEQVAADLLAATTRNLSPTVQKQLRVRVGTKNVGVPGTENIGKVMAKMNQAESVNKAVKTFNDTFRAMAKVNPTLGMLRNQGLGRSSNRVAALLVQHERTWNPVNIADRKAIWRDWRTATPNGSSIPAGVDGLGNPIDNAVEHVDEQIRALQDSVDQLGITPNEIGAWLNDPKVRLDVTTAPGWKVGPTGLQSRIEGEASQDWLINFVRHNDKIDDPGPLLFGLHAALEHSVAKRTVNQSAAQHFGVPVAVSNAPKEALSVAKTLKAQGYRTVDLPGTEGMLFHPDIAEGLVKVNAIMNDRITMDKWLRGLDQATLVFKGAVTRYNPSFHVRTLASEFMLSFIGGMKNPGWAYPKAAQVMRGRGKTYHGPDFPGITPPVAGDRQGINAANAMTEPEQLLRTPGDGMKVVFRHPTFGNLTSDQVWGLFRNSGLKTGFATTDVQRTMNPVRSTNPLSKINGKLQNRFEDVEDFGRLAHFMDILKTSKHKTLDEAVAEAAETVLKYHLDYTAVTQFEKSWMNRAMPFYKWVRLSTPMILESMAHNPGKAMAVPKALANMSQTAGYDVNGFGIAPGGADALTPGFLREAGALPLFNAFGDNQYFNPAQTVPIYGLLNESNQNPINKLNPFGKVPVELALNKSAMGPPPRDEGNLKKYLLGQTPQTNLGQIMANRGSDESAAADVDKRQRLLSFIANPGFQPATPRRVEGEAQMEWDRASKHRRAVKKQLGIE